MTLKEILAGYADGLFSRGEFLSRLVEVAAELPPPDVLELVPPDLVSALKDLAAKPPRSPDEIIFIHGHVPKRYESDEEAAIAAQHAKESLRLAQLAHFKGAWALHSYFYPEE